MTSEQAPAVRGSHLKDDLKSLDALGAPTAARIRARLRPDTIRSIEQASGTRFLPLALNIEMAEAVFAEAGEEGVRRWGTASLVASLDGFFKPLLIGLTRLVAPSPSLLYKTMPQGWTTTYQGCGELYVSQVAPGVTRIVGRGLPPQMQSQAFRLAVCGTLAAAFEIARYQGAVGLEPLAEGPGDVSWLAEWRPRRPDPE
jgi:hypothetical protein